MRQNFKRPVSAVLAAIMLMSAVSTTAIAFAEDGANMSSSTSVVENVTPESSSAVPEEGIDSSSVPEEDLVYPDSTGNSEGEASASTSESTPEQSSSESTSQPDSAVPSAPEPGESDSSEPSSVPPEESVDGELPPVEVEEPIPPEFVWLELIAQNSRSKILLLRSL